MVGGWPFLTALVVSLVQGASGYSPQMVHITQLEVPESPRSGEDVTLTCRFRLEGDNHRLYTVNWWRDRDQFYTYKENNLDPKFTYAFPGIHVQKESSTAESVVLRNVSEDTSGLFKCEVMGEGPSFRTAVGTKAMNVVVPPQDVEITWYAHPGALQYRVGDWVQLNCTARGSKPKSHLTWEINHTQVGRGSTIQYRDHEDSRGRVTSTVGLHWRVPETLLANHVLVTCVAAVGGERITDSQQVFLDPSSRAAFNHYASAGCKLLSGWALLYYLVSSLFLATSCA